MIESEAVAMAWRIKGQPRCPEQRSKYDTVQICIQLVSMSSMAQNRKHILKEVYHVFNYYIHVN